MSNSTVARSDWNLEGKRVKGTYLDMIVSGIVTNSRVCYGGSIKHTVKLDTPVGVTFDNDDPYRHCVSILESDDNSLNRLQKILD